MKKLNKKYVVDMAIGVVLLTGTLSHFVRMNYEDGINKSLKVFNDQGYKFVAPDGTLFNPTEFTVNFGYKNPFKKKA